MAKLGPEGLKQAATALEKAMQEHDRPIPPAILKSFPVPTVKTISWIPVQSVQEPGQGRKVQYQASPEEQLPKVIESDGSPLPFFVQYDHVEVREL